MPIRVLLADDHAIIRDAMTSTIGARGDIVFVGEAADGREAVRLALELVPDVVVMDIGMPELNGIDATRQIVDANPRIKVLALSMHAGQRFVTEMLHAGARGYVLKASPLNELELAQSGRWPRDRRTWGAGPPTRFSTTTSGTSTAMPPRLLRRDGGTSRRASESACSCSPKAAPPRR